MKRHLISQLSLVLLISSAASANYIVSLNTGPLVGTGTFELDLQFLDGSGLPGDLNNNVVALTSFTFGPGGSALGGGTATGGASGSLATGVTLKDTVFFNEYIEDFTPGSMLSFVLNTTNNPDPGGTPDLFTLAILDGFGNELPTTGPASEFLDVALTGGVSPQISTFGSAPNSAFSLTPPTVQHQGPSPVPEPSALLLLGSVALIAEIARRHRHIRPAIFRICHAVNRVRANKEPLSARTGGRFPS